MEGFNEMQQWLVGLVGRAPDKKISWTFNSREEAENFISDRYNLIKHLKYDPDNSYYILPVE